jgi:hypothetical protein
MSFLIEIYGHLGDGLIPEKPTHTSSEKNITLAKKFCVKWAKSHSGGIYYHIKSNDVDLWFGARKVPFGNQKELYEVYTPKTDKENSVILNNEVTKLRKEIEQLKQSLSSSQAEVGNLQKLLEEEKNKVNSYNSSQRASDAYRGNSYYGSGYANSSGDGRLSRSDYASLPDYNSSGSSQYYNRDGWKKTGFDSDNS